MRIEFIKFIIKRAFYITLVLLPLNCTYDFTIAPWENGQIPYYLSGEFTEKDLRNLANAMKSWEDVSDRVSFPEGTRHGTVFRAPEKLVKKLMELE